MTTAKAGVLAIVTFAMVREVWMMSCEYRILASRNLVSKTYTGRITTRSVLDLIDRMEADPEYRPGMMEFDDLRGVTELAIPPRDVARFADLMMGLTARRRKCTRKAIVVGSEAVRRAAESFASNIEEDSDLDIGIFDDASRAFAFLDLRDLGLGALADA